MSGTATTAANDGWSRRNPYFLFFMKQAPGQHFQAQVGIKQLFMADRSGKGCHVLPFRVVEPGVQPLAGPLSVVQAVMVAEGIKDTAQPRQAVVLRRGPQGQRQVIPVDLEAALSGTDLSGDVPLHPFDVVIVPRSGIADVGRWVDLYIRRVLPVSLGFNYTIDRNGVAR